MKINRKPKIEKASEAEIAFGVLVIAYFQPNGIATFRRLRREIPLHVRLSNFDAAPSIVDPNDENWMANIRRLKTNKKQAGNFIHDGFLVHIPRVGFKITELGRARRLRGRVDRHSRDREFNEE